MRIFIFLLLVTALFAGLGVDMALAADPDKEIYCDTVDLLEGSVGKLLGMLVALSGFLIFIRGSMFGLVLLICGVIVTVSPQVLTSVLGGLELASSGTKADGSSSSNSGTIMSAIDCS